MQVVSLEKEKEKQKNKEEVAPSWNRFFYIVFLNSHRLLVVSHWSAQDQQHKALQSKLGTVVKISSQLWVTASTQQGEN
jgi:hypothetical protein